MGDITVPLELKNYIFYVKHKMKERNMKIKT